MKVLLTGAHGQVGSELRRTTPSGVQLIAVASNELDITDQRAVVAAVSAHRPAWVINAAAYTAVDKAEQDAGRAMAVNAQGARHLATAANEVGARVVHLSTDFIFDGSKSSPYTPSAPANPLGVYGQSKWEGERAVLAACPDALVVRTAWVYSSFGNNFVKTMLRLMRERPQLGVVADQVGTPTWAHDLAGIIWRCVSTSSVRGIHHWTDAGVASWYDFAVAIQEEALALGLLPQSIPVLPIRTQDYPTPARRPAYSVLDKTATWQALGMVSAHWRVSLRKMLVDLKQREQTL